MKSSLFVICSLSICFTIFLKDTTDCLQHSQESNENFPTELENTSNDGNVVELNSRKFRMSKKGLISPTNRVKYTDQSGPDAKPTNIKEDEYNISPNSRKLVKSSLPHDDEDVSSHSYEQTYPDETEDTSLEKSSESEFTGHVRLSAKYENPIAHALRVNHAIIKTLLKHISNSK